MVYNRRYDLMQWNTRLITADGSIVRGREDGRVSLIDMRKKSERLQLRGKAKREEKWSTDACLVNASNAGAGWKMQ